MNSIEEIKSELELVKRREKVLLKTHADLIKDIAQKFNSFSLGNQSGHIAQRFNNLLIAIERASNYVIDLEACEFKSENGIGCRKKAIRISHGKNCCEEHALTRDSYFK